MKKSYALIMAAICAMLLFNTCSIEKRHYRPGYHVEWKHQVRTAPVKPLAENIQENNTPVNTRQEVLPATKKDIVQVTHEQEKRILKKNPETFLTEKKAVSKQRSKTQLSLPAIVPVFTHSTTAKTPASVIKADLSSPAISDDGRLVFGIIFLLLGLSPFAVLVYVGQGSEFTLDLVVWAAGLVLLLLGFIVDSVFLVYAGWIFLLAAWVYAIVVMVRRTT